MKVAIAGVKGGAGKSTSAVALACVGEALLPGKIVLVDLDPQATSSRWVPHLAKRAEDAASLADATRGVDVAILDLPPGRSDGATMGLAAADIVVAICGLGPGELDGLAATMRLVEPDLILPTRMDRRRAMHHEALDLLKSKFGKKVLDPIPASAVVERSQASGTGLPELSPPGIAYAAAWSRIEALMKEA